MPNAVDDGCHRAVTGRVSGGPMQAGTGLIQQSNPAEFAAIGSSSDKASGPVTLARHRPEGEKRVAGLGWRPIARIGTCADRQVSEPTLVHRSG